MAWNPLGVGNIPTQKPTTVDWIGGESKCKYTDVPTLVKKEGCCKY